MSKCSNETGEGRAELERQFVQKRWGLKMTEQGEACTLLWSDWALLQN